MEGEGFEIRQIFEYELRRKLSMRAKTSTSEMSMLNNAFRFYDVNNTGNVGRNEWVRTFGKIGLNGFSEKDLLFLFDIYDINQVGLINYKNFTAYLYDQSTLQPLEQQQVAQMPQQQQQQQQQQLIMNDVEVKAPIADDVQVNNNNMNIQQQQQQLQQLQQLQQQEQQQHGFTCPTPAKNSVKQYFKQILDELRYKVNSKSGITYYTFASKLKGYEDNIRKTISFDEFVRALSEAQVNVDIKLCKDFFFIIDICDENNVSTDEILRLIKGPLSERRKMLIVNQFAMIDKERLGYCPIGLLKSLYKADEHPEVKMGRKTPNEVYGEFIFSMDIYVNLKGLNEQIGFEDFIEYYHGISGSIGDDNYFADMLNGVWNKAISVGMEQEQMQRRRTPMMSPPPQQQQQPMQDEGFFPNSRRKSTPMVHQQQQPPLQQQQQQQQPPQQQPTPNRRFPTAHLPRYNPISNTFTLPQNFNQPQLPPQQQQPHQHQQQPPIQMQQQPSNVLFKLRNILKCRGIKGIFGFQRMLKLLDKDNTHTLTQEQIQNLSDSYRLSLSPPEIAMLIANFSQPNTQTLNTDTLLQALIGQLSPFRINLIKQVFASIDVNGSGYISSNDIKSLFNAARHPEVVSNKRTEDEVLGEWLDNFEIFSEYNGTANIGERQVSFDEFLYFYSLISMSSEDDRYFEYMVVNTWNLDKKQRMQSAQGNSRGRSSGNPIVGSNSGSGSGSGYTLNYPY